MAADEESTPPLRRGRGLRLSMPAPPPDEPRAEPVPPVAAPVLARGRGLRLTTPADSEAAPMLRASVRVPFGLTAYRSAGNGPPLLLLHGFGASGRFWRGVISALAEHRTCYAPDLPGFGGSAPRDRAPTLETLADEVLAFADALGLARFDLAGHSLGAAVAATVAGRRPERIDRLALTSLAVRPFAPELLALAAARLPFDVSLDLARPVIDLWRPWTGLAMMTPPAALLLGAQLLAGPAAEARLWQEYLADHARADGRAYITSIASQGDPALLASLRAIAAPTLLICGREDRVARLPEVLIAQSMIRGARLEVIEGCGHLPAIERPDTYHAILRGFFPT